MLCAFVAIYRKEHKEGTKHTEIFIFFAFAKQPVTCSGLKTIFIFGN
jgi:hypothetical protein